MVTTSKACIGLAAQPVVWWSLATLKTTGCGLAGSTVQSLEGVAYLVVAGFALAGLTTRVRKGGAGLAAAELEAAEAEGSAFAAATAAGADAAKAAPATSARFFAERRVANLSHASTRASLPTRTSTMSTPDLPGTVVRSCRRQTTARDRTPSCKALPPRRVSRTVLALLIVLYGAVSVHEPSSLSTWCALCQRD